MKRAIDLAHYKKDQTCSWLIKGISLRKKPRVKPKFRVDTIEGEGANELGTLFSLKDKTRERVRLLMEDLFKKSYLSISASKEIKNFKSEI